MNSCGLVPTVMAMHYVVLALLLSAASLSARADIYECIDQNGNKRFTNIAAEARGCKALNIAVPASAPPAPGIATSKSQSRAPTVATPTSFPRVERQVQRERDHDRRRILEHELGQEEKLLADAKKELSETVRVVAGDDALHRKVRLHESNVASLRKEISKVR